MSTPRPATPKPNGVTHWCGEFIPHSPSTRQVEFLKLADVTEAYYGGAAGGGKSDALLMAALQFVSVAGGYAALLLRRTYADLSLQGALMDRAHDWLQGTAAKWHDREKTWKFPSGAALTFGYLENEKDKYRYQSSEFQFIGFDEVTQFSETQYLYLFSRLRRLSTSDVPLRMRSASNPDGEGLEWVKARFVPEQYAKTPIAERFARVWRKGECVFVPARLDDNPYIDQVEYRKSLGKLDVVTQARLEHGDFDAEPTGDRIRREWFENAYFPDLPEGAAWKWRAWDLAVNETEQDDFHASVKACVFNNDLWLGAPMIWKEQWADAIVELEKVMDIEKTITHGTGKSNHETAAVQSLIKRGKMLIQYPESKDKLSRANAWIPWARQYRVKLVGSREQWKQFVYWWYKFGTDEGTHDDSVDAVSGIAAMAGLVIEQAPSPPPKAEDPYRRMYYGNRK